jgi:multidrug efflux pump subunit AcrA (membrane-fusion protein)
MPVVQRNSRTLVWSLAAIAVVIVCLLAVRLAEGLAAKKAVISKEAVPSVSVTEVGLSTLPTTVQITGTIAARYDMPIGV